MSRNRYQKTQPIKQTETGNAPDSYQHRVIVNKSGATTEFNAVIKLRKYSVFWAIPMDELCFSLWFSNYVHLQIMPWDDIAIVMSTYLPEARNALHNHFLDSQTKYMVMLDSDVMPPPNFLERLIAHNKPIVGGYYHRKNGKFEPVVYDRVGDDWRIRTKEGQGLEKVDGAGAGCWLMRRDAAEAIGRNPYNMNRGGEDFELCLKLKEAGIPIYIDWSIACAHVGVGFH